MLDDVCIGAINWLLKVAREGLQRWVWVENGLASMIWDRPPMAKLARLLGLDVTTINCCAYSVFRGLGVNCQYPTREGTGKYDTPI